MEPKIVDPTREPGILRRTYSVVATSRPARFLSRRLAWKLDPFLLRITGGRCSTTLMIRSAVLETTGARTGRRRRNAVIYFHDGDRITIVAAHAGAPRHPGWFHNLRSHPEVTFAGVPMHASVVEDDRERARLERLADRVLPAFARFRADAAEANRVVPIIQLSERRRAVER